MRNIFLCFKKKKFSVKQVFSVKPLSLILSFEISGFFENQFANEAFLGNSNFKNRFRSMQQSLKKYKKINFTTNFLSRFECEKKEKQQNGGNFQSDF